MFRVFTGFRGLYTLPIPPGPSIAEHRNVRFK